MNRLHQLARLGQSIWYDNIQRSLIDSGEIQDLIDLGITGVTSNPTIFEKAIAGSDDYDDDIRRLLQSKEDPEGIFEALAVADIRRTADLLMPVHEKTQGGDGFVSIEVSPRLAANTDGTVTEARRLHAAIDRPNVMIKVPATPEGITAIRTLIGEAISINVTLIFGMSHYEAVAEAYRSGVEDLKVGGGDLSRVASVASFFISRLDTAVDGDLDRLGAAELKGRIAIANAAVAFACYRKWCADDRWQRLVKEGARPQRLLWASTGTKNPAYPDTHYVDRLIGDGTVNTVPPTTLQAFVDHGTVAPTLEAALEASRGQLDRVRDLGIDMETVTRTLQQEGLEAFAASFESLMVSIAEKAKILRGAR